MWTAVIPAEAKRPRRYAGEVVQDWKICRNGAELTIGATDQRLRLVATSGSRTLARVALSLRTHRHTVWVLNDIPTDPDEVIIDNPDTDPAASPDEVQPDDFGLMLDFATTVKVRWWRPAARTVKLGLNPLDDSSPPPFATYRVGNCLLLPGSWTGAFDVLTSWLPDLTTLFQTYLTERRR
jgi:hypothetical protein